MRILVIGSGGREHALVWKIAQSKLVDKIFCAPGNGGILDTAECIDIKPESIEELVKFAKKEKIGLTVVGPEAPLAAGIVDEFLKQGLKIFGPSKIAARLEASKVFAKEFLARYNIPTANFKLFDNTDEARSYIDKIGTPCVVKADGLAQGKGVVVSQTKDEAFLAVKSFMEDKIFGASGNKIIVEDCLEGQEASIIVITDTKTVIPLAASQDHKRVFDNDEGPNTGGMGAYSPAPIVTPELFKEILERIIYPTINGLAKEGIDYKGVLYAGIMLTKDGPKVLEFNVRFGDPETQAILPRLDSDLVEAMVATADNKLGRIKLNWSEKACVCVVAASGGYPGNYEKGKEISGLEEARQMKDIVVFHAGTKIQKSSAFAKASADVRRSSPTPSASANEGGQRHKYLTNGGRVLGVTGLGKDIKEAIARTYQAVSKIQFEGMHYRKDIGRRALGN